MTVREDAAARRANVVGLGLIGGSIAARLSELGWRVTGRDSSPEVEANALGRQLIDDTGLDEQAEITFIATPVSRIAEVAAEALERTRGYVTDVGSVKAPIVAAVDSARFVAGHPMAGSEQDGIASARPGLFRNAVWVLTPTALTNEFAYATVRETIRELGAEVVSMRPAIHDSAVARVSHVPHLAAATLMIMAAGARLNGEGAALRLAAGGFRDMTRIAAGKPDIWLDICEANKDAIVASLDDLIEVLQDTRSIVDGGDAARLRELLTGARRARKSLPTGIPAELELCEVRVTVSDRPGELARLTTLAPEINIYDFEIAHSFEGRQGVAILVIADRDRTDLLVKLKATGYAASTRMLQ